MQSSQPLQKFWLANSDDIKERRHTLFACQYKEDIQTAFVFRFNGQCVAYLNRCVHMPFRLDCEKSTIFSETRDHIKCSMHGIIYDPLSGTALSPTMCTGEKLTAINVVETDNCVWVADEFVDTVLNGYLEGGS